MALLLAIPLTSSSGHASELPLLAQKPGAAIDFHRTFGRSGDPAGLAGVHVKRVDDLIATEALLVQHREGQMEVGLAIGGQFGNTVTLDPSYYAEYDADAGLMTKVILDYFINDRVAIGGNITSIYSYTEAGGDIAHYSFGPTVKTRFIAGSNSSAPISITPGLGVSFSSFSDDNDSYTGSLITLSCDFRKQMSSGMDLFVETGLFAQPTGGNSDIDITFGPTLYILIGAGWIVN